MSGGDVDTPYRGAIVNGEHRFALRVYFEDTDLSGIVYHANYLKFMERARSDFLRALGFEQRGTLEAGEGAYAIAEVRIRYLGPARLEDELVVVSTLAKLLAASATIHQRVMRAGEVLADATIVAAFLTPDGRPRRQPKPWFDKMKPLVRREVDE